MHTHIGTLDGAEPAIVQEPVTLATAPQPRRNHRSAKKAGAEFEKVVAIYLAARLDDDRIERRTKNGSKDRGDITGVKTIRGGRVVIECKNTARTDLPGWLREVEEERGNDDAVVGVVVHKKIGTTAPGAQYVTMDLETFARLLEGGVDL
jgi:hypothetical protein